MSGAVRSGMVTWGLFTCCALALIACDGSSSGDPAGPAATGTDPVGTGTTGTGTGGPTTPTTGTASGTVPKPSALPALGCTRDQVLLRGTLGGQALTEDLSLPSGSIGGTTLGAFAGGGLALSTAEVDATQSATLAGAFVLPQNSGRAGEVFCAAAGSLVSEGDDGNVALVGSLLGRCSTGTSVPGTVYLCNDSGQGYCSDSGPAERQRLGGTIDGVTLSPGTSASSFQGGGSQAVALVGGYQLLLFPVGNPTASTPVPVTAYLVGLTPGADAGAVYCAESGSWALHTDNIYSSVTTISLSGLRRIGNCTGAAATDRLDACFGI